MSKITMANFKNCLFFQFLMEKIRTLVLESYLLSLFVGTFFGILNQIGDELVRLIVMIAFTVRVMMI